jgi:signal transduction histidine kinase
MRQNLPVKLYLILNLEPELPKFIKADSLRLWQVIMNLLTNTFKFTESGEIEFRVELNKHATQHTTHVKI